ncbi:hypothetical protein F0562_028279 [Nyssa sinensis]|uniref:Uncharacterized protein n=1 Tax=Nyssa sinensis TaxID=561372 RepID=A0A5J5BBR8_9ASTE|nr:hypothetical protein F0562_028279 [Nyssa sinensis]
MDLETSLMNTISMLSARVEEQRKQNRKREMKLLMDECLATKQLPEMLTLEDLRDLSSFLDGKLKQLKDRLETLKASDTTQLDFLHLSSDVYSDFYMP